MQGTFDFHRDLPDRPIKPERLFFAVLPDSATACQMKEFGEHFANDNRLSGTPLTSERLHVSLHHVGDPADVVFDQGLDCVLDGIAVGWPG
ncbi:hypothetical protein G3545_07005 [Starkeya sp. ORNL1]|uniref:hypothetical protein n=1 Tax=Starkeya sp. ORNL1 TaxID=2709380 RepID=UPI00146291C1|nr:hypothetical protein [Starkeya sp. ORNL1]QJP13425.1 hypothetical protein G3545_07005 [Starkeya sp. ORNL1]